MTFYVIVDGEGCVIGVAKNLNGIQEIITNDYKEVRKRSVERGFIDINEYTKGLKTIQKEIHKLKKDILNDEVTVLVFDYTVTKNDKIYE